MGYVIESYDESVTRANPEWHRLDELLRAACFYAPDYERAFDRALVSGPEAWRGGQAEARFNQIQDWRHRARRGAESTIEAIRRARDAQPETLTETFQRTRYVEESELLRRSARG